MRQSIPLHHHPNDGGYHGECKRCMMERAAPALVAALHDLVAADNCNYCAETMRREGYFDAARKALADAGVSLDPRDERFFEKGVTQ